MSTCLINCLHQLWAYGTLNVIKRIIRQSIVKFLILHTLLLTEIGISYFNHLYYFKNLKKKQNYIFLQVSLAKLYNVCNFHTIYIYFCINIIPMTII